jgi:dTDP-4-dehydrorhamnose 3,5-epimerase
MQVTPLAIPDVLLIQPRRFEDERGYFMETYQAQKFAAIGIRETFVQDNRSGSHRGVLRGLHYQIRHPQGKLVQVLSGEIFDVAVDLRRSAPTFGRWAGIRLVSDNRQMLWIPAGFAHGFMVLSEWAEVMYKTTDFYAPEWERTLLWDDPQVGVTWPLETGVVPRLSVKDLQGKRLAEAECFD